MHKRIIALGATAATFAPMLAFAASKIQSQFSPYITDIISLVSLLVPFMITLAVLFFLWGLAKFVLAAGDESARESGKAIMIWGIIAITVMVSLWGLVALLQSIFGITGTGNVQSVPVPTV